MADRAQCDLPYGHFGRGIYSLDDHTWHFERSLEFSSNTQQLSEPTTLFKPSQRSSDIDRGADRGGPLSKRVQRQIKALTDSKPQLIPASGFLSPFLGVSEAVQNAVRRHDPLKGSLIAFGNIQSHSRNRPIPVAAYVAGSTGCDLYITQVQKQKRGWDDDRRFWLEVPALQGESAIWSSHGGPIQAVRFASNIQPGPALLAVRLLTRTTIIRTVQVKRSSQEGLGSSISTSILYDVSIEQTGGHTHADVDFNPWFSQQVALVDTAGQWTVLEFSTRSMDKVARTWSSMAREATDKMDHSINDGWARIAWVLNLGTIAVCTRTSLALFSIAEDMPVLIENIEMRPFGTMPWILEFLVLPGRYRDHFCVLTSTHILVYQVADKTSSQKAASIRFRVRHFKNPEDLSLSLAAWSENEEGIGLLMSSSLPGPMSYYRLSLSHADPFIIADHMDVPSSTDAHQYSSIISIKIQSVGMAHKATMTASERPFRSARFFSALVVRADLSLCQTLFCIPGDAAVRPLTWEAKLATSNFRLSRPDFVVEDSLLSLEIAAGERVEPTARRTRQAKLQPPPKDRRVGLEQVTNLLQSPTEVTEPIAEVLATIKSELVRSDSDIVRPMRTLYSFAQAELDVRNVEDCSTALEIVLQSVNGRIEGSPGPAADAAEHSPRLIFAPVTTPPALGLQELRLGIGLASVYDQLLAAWVTPLSEIIPGRVRISKAKLCGLVAAQLVLASQSIRVEEPLEILPQDETRTQTQTQDSYSQISQAPDQKPSGHRAFALSQLESSQPFPSSALPTPSQTPSITTASSHPSTFVAPEVNRLSKYTTFSKPAPPALPRSLNNVLSHWQVGEDVNEYDWMSTSRTIAKHDNDADDDLTETERRKAQRRAERHLRRQRKEAAASQARQIASSQAPEIFSASQPLSLRIESQPSGVVASSSQFTGPATGAAAASQVETGRFGGRPAPAAGKKRRRQGF